ncbi:DUF1349 domain-containing protein [Chlorogloeopsis sp. ULAP02]|uniref:DUF1349 domain-containing protein n=1 Tax=Chlorogloeopsis sp. ULAP02 TaxID=3107926 RepID=UPI0031350586
MLMRWYNEPPSWEQQEDLIVVTSGANTDFWRRSDCGYIRDNGNFYYQEVKGDFTARVKISNQYQNLHGQAGLMIRVDEKTWLKSNIEFVDGMHFVSTVITNEESNWSVVPLLDKSPSLWLCLHRRGNSIEVQYSLDEESYTILTTAHLTEEEAVQVGLVCASPENEGCQITFQNFQIEAIKE